MRWTITQCDYHPLVVCSCGACRNKEAIECKGKAYKTRFRLDCRFHTLLYEIECHERANQAKELIHPVLKRGHSNALEASHNVFIRFRSKDVLLQRLHYHLSTNLALLQANLTYMLAKFGTKYHWSPEVYRRMGLPVFEGVQEALHRHSAQRKRKLERAQTTPVKRRRVELKRMRVKDGISAQNGPKNMAMVTHMAVTTNLCAITRRPVTSVRGQRVQPKQTFPVVLACLLHKRPTHRDCPFSCAAIVDSEGEGVECGSCFKWRARI